VRRVSVGEVDGWRLAAIGEFKKKKDIKSDFFFERVQFRTKIGNRVSEER
jgi:hypothetical protein